MPHLRAVHELFVDAFSAGQIEQIDELTTALRGHLGLERESGGERS